MKPAHDLLPVCAAAPADLGTMKSGLDSDSAVKRLQADNDNTQKDATTSEPSPPPFTENLFAALDKAFAEAFSAERMLGDPELLRLAQEASRQCMAELFTGNNLMRLSPEQIMSLQDEISRLTNQIAHEALTLVQQYTPQKGGKSTHTRSVDIRRALQEEIKALRPVQDFTFKYFSRAAQIDAEHTQKQAGNGKETQ